MNSWISVTTGIVAWALFSHAAPGAESTMTRPIIPPTSDVAALAAEVREVYRKQGGIEALHLLWALAAENLTVLQQPYQPITGLTDGKMWAAKFPAENAARSRVMRDFNFDIPQIVANGYELELPLVVYRGTMPDGSKLNIRARMVFVIHDGKVVHFTFANMMADPKEREEQYSRNRTALQIGRAAPQ